MKLRLARVAFVLLIMAATMLASAIAVRRAWRGEWEKAKDILRPQDKALAVALWEDPRYTVSAQCGERGREKDCRFCRFVRRLLGDAHVDGASRNEIPTVGL